MNRVRWLVSLSLALVFGVLFFVGQQGVFGVTDMVVITGDTSVITSGTSGTANVSFTCTAFPGNTLTQCSAQGCTANTTSCIGQPSCDIDCDPIVFAAGLELTHTVTVSAIDTALNKETDTHDITVDTECGRSKDIITNWGTCDPKTGQQTRTVRLRYNDCSTSTKTEMQGCQLTPVITAPMDYQTSAVTIYGDNFYPTQSATGVFVSRTKTEVFAGGSRLTVNSSVTCIDDNNALECEIGALVPEVPACLGLFVLKVVVQPKSYQQSDGGWDNGDNAALQSVTSASFFALADSVASSLQIDSVSALENWGATAIQMNELIAYNTTSSPNYCLQDEIHISGTSFGHERLGAQVFIKGVEVGKYLSWTDTEIVVTPPAISSGLWSTRCPRQSPRLGLITEISTASISDIQVVCAPLLMCTRLCTVTGVTPLSAATPLSATVPGTEPITHLTNPTNKQYLTEELVTIQGTGFMDVRDVDEFTDSGAPSTDQHSAASVEFYSDGFGFVPAMEYQSWTDTKIVVKAPKISFETVYGGLTPYKAGVSAAGMPVRVCTRKGCITSLLTSVPAPPAGPSGDGTPSITTLMPSLGIGGQIISIGGDDFCATQNCGNAIQEILFGAWQETEPLIGIPGVPGRIFDINDTRILVEVPEKAISGPLLLTRADGVSAGVVTFTKAPLVMNIEPDLITKRDTVTFQGTGFHGSFHTTILPPTALQGVVPTLELWSIKGYLFPDLNRTSADATILTDQVPFSFFPAHERAYLLNNPVSIILSNWDGTFSLLDRRTLPDTPALFSSRVSGVNCTPVGPLFDFTDCSESFSDYATHIKVEFETPILDTDLLVFAGSNVVEYTAVTGPNTRGYFDVALFINTVYNDVEAEFSSSAGFLPISISSRVSTNTDQGGIILIERTGRGALPQSIAPNSSLDWRAFSGIDRNLFCLDGPCDTTELLFPGLTAASEGLPPDDVQFFAKGFASVKRVMLNPEL